LIFVASFDDTTYFAMSAVRPSGRSSIASAEAFRPCAGCVARFDTVSELRVSIQWKDEIRESAKM
jgi:hypothetical protein